MRWERPGAGTVADRAGPAAAFALAGAARGARNAHVHAAVAHDRRLHIARPKPGNPDSGGQLAAGIAHTARPGDCSRLEQVTGWTHLVGQIPDADLTLHARELAGLFEAALVCTGTDVASS